MPTKQSIKAIHAAATRAGLPDSEYRGVLADVGNHYGLTFASSKDVPQNLVGDVLDAIHAKTTRRPGWQPAQLSKVRQYQRLAGLDDQSIRVIIHEISGQMHEDSPKLTQYHFDRTMVRLEMRVADRVAAGNTTWPARFQPCYWRYRNQSGTMNSRQSWEIRDLWAKLSGMLPADKQTDTYLLGIARHAAGRRVKDISSLTPWQASNLIDALKDRLHYAMQEGA